MLTRKIRNPCSVSVGKVGVRDQMEELDVDGNILNWSSKRIGEVPWIHCNNNSSK
jgi:hypothetical protein